MSEESENTLAVIRQAKVGADGDPGLVLARLTVALCTVAVVEGIELSFVLKVTAKIYRDALAKIPAHARGDGARDDVN